MSILTKTVLPFTSKSSIVLNLAILSLNNNMNFENLIVNYKI